MSFGWGLADVEAAVNLVSDVAAGSTSSQIAELNYSGTDVTQDVQSDGTEPLKVTIVWTDPAGTPVGLDLDDATPILVNDLDLLVTGPDGTHFPWTLVPNDPGAPAVRTTANHLDNVEQVLIDAPAAGTYTIQVSATGAVGNQDFSMVVTGASSATVLSCDFDGDGQCTGTDIDALQANLVNGPADPATFDLDGDGQVTISDRDAWLAEAGAENLPSGNPYLPGDATLNGAVDVADFNVWNSNRFTFTSDWTRGDFNADGRVDTSDFNIWNSFKFSTSDLAAISPTESLALSVEQYADPHESVRRNHQRALAGISLDIEHIDIAFSDGEL